MPLDSLLHIRKSLNQIDHKSQDGIIVGLLKTVTEDTINHLGLILSNNKFRVTIRPALNNKEKPFPAKIRSSSDLKSDTDYNVRIEFNLSEIFFFETTNKFFNVSINIDQQRYYIYDLETSSYSKTYHNLIECFLTLTCFLKQLNEYPEQDKQFFFRGTDSILTVNYKITRDEFNRINLNSFFSNLAEKKLENETSKAVSEALEIIKQNTKHILSEASRNTIFINELTKTFVSHKTEIVDIFNHWSEIYDRTLKSHKVYTDKFSFDSIFTQNRTYLKAYTKDLSESVSKFSTYLFTTPIAFILAISKFSISKDDLLSDTFIIILILFYAISLEWLFLSSLRSSFRALSREIKAYKVIENQIDLSDDDKETLQELESKSNFLKNTAIWILRILIVLCLLLPLTIYCNNYNFPLIKVIPGTLIIYGSIVRLGNLFINKKPFKKASH